MDTTHPVHRIVDALGGETIQARLGVGKFAIRAARRDRRFPALWYKPISEMCAEEGIDCPIDAFRWKGDDAEGEA